MCIDSNEIENVHKVFTYLLKNNPNAVEHTRVPAAAASEVATKDYIILSTIYTDLIRYVYERFTIIFLCVGILYTYSIFQLFIRTWNIYVYG